MAGGNRSGCGTSTPPANTGSSAASSASAETAGWMPPVARARRVSTGGGGTRAGRDGDGAAELTRFFPLYPCRFAGDPRRGHAHRGHQGRAELPVPLHGRGGTAARAGEMRHSGPGNSVPREFSSPAAALKRPTRPKSCLSFNCCGWQRVNKAFRSPSHHPHPLFSMGPVILVTVPA